MFKSLDELIDELNDKKAVKFQVKVCANSSKDIIDFSGETIKIKIMAPAIEGRANKAIIGYLSKIAGVAKTKIKIISGEKSSIKIISIQL